jgi:hypothetical protein
MDKDIRCLKLREHLFEGHTYPSGNVGGWHHIEGNISSNNFGKIDNIVDASDLEVILLQMYQLKIPMVFGFQK